MASRFSSCSFLTKATTSSRAVTSTTLPVWESIVMEPTSPTTPWSPYPGLAYTSGSIQTLAVAAYLKPWLKPKGRHVERSAPRGVLFRHFQLLTSSDHALATVVSIRSASDRLEAPMAVLHQ